MLFTLGVNLLSAQIFSAGLKGGLPFTQSTCCNGVNNRVDYSRWTIGPTIEFHVFGGFSVEADALYRGYHRQGTFASSETVSGSETYPAFLNTFDSKSRIWDFPLLLKYGFHIRSARPFIDAGYTLSHSTSDITSSFVCLSSAAICSASSLSSYFRPLNKISDSGVIGGPTVGIGLAFKRSHVTIAPELRYNRFSNPTTNQISLLVGFTF